MAKKLSKEELEQRIFKLVGDRFELVRWCCDNDFGSNKRVIMRCLSDGKEWVTRPCDIMQGKGCPMCAGLRRWTSEERIEQINRLEDIEFISWVDGYKNSYSKANVRCKIDGFEWSATANNLVNTRSGCPTCARLGMYTADEWIEKINEIGNIEFISWVKHHKNSKSKANVRCTVDNFEWSVAVHSIVKIGTGCPRCANMIRWTASERVEQINELKNIEFVSWVGSYKNQKSKANVKCTVDGFEWITSVNHLVNNGNGCPRCAKYCFQLDKKGYLYALRSECGKYVKVGISNNPSRRHYELARATPFTFNLVEQVSGDGAKIAELEKHFHDKYERAGFTGFNGCTEWLICTPQLLEELRELEDVK